MNKYITVGLFLLSLSLSANAEICGRDDDRRASTIPSVGRLIKEGNDYGCTVTLIGPSCAVTSGVCAGKMDVAEFNVPASIAGIPQHPNASDIYPVDKSYFDFDAKGIGQQWAVIRFRVNPSTGKLPGDVQGFAPIVSKKPKKNDAITVIQYGYALDDADYVRSGDVNPNPYGDEIHYAQQSTPGKLIKAGIFLIPEIYEVDADTSYGSAGAPIFHNQSGELIGIVTHGGCQAKYTTPAGARYTNSGTSIVGNKKFKAAIDKCLARE